MPLTEEIRQQVGEAVISGNLVQIIKSGGAPQAAKMAAARGMFPLTNEEMIEVLVTLASDEDEEVRAAAAATIDTLQPESFTALAGDTATSAEVLSFLCLWPRAPRELVEAVIFNGTTPDGALAHLAGRSKDPAIVEAISLKQQSLIREPAILEAILANPARTPEAERRANEVRQEFFEKEFGAQMVAEEQRARAESESAAQEAEAPPTVPPEEIVSVGGLEDLIRLGLIEEGIDDTIVADYEAEYGPFDLPEIVPAEPFDIEALVGEIVPETGEELLSPDRIPIFQQVALMTVKERVMLAIKGTREARAILVRDPNRIIAGAVLRNPRLTDTEIESIASLRTVPEEVLRQIGQNRAWTKSYTVIHNLVRNPRTPIAVSLGFLNRIQTRDLRALSTNKNIPDVIRTTTARLYIKRSGG